MNYYNEWEPYPAQWLRNLIAAGHIPKGEVDERSIADVRPDDLKGFTQCHFFAGIAGWSLALKLAGWPEDREVWTGSCPCQPFSVAGKRKGFTDERHLWPEFRRLIAERKPQCVFGEQVDDKIWIDSVCDDLEASDYTCGAAILGTFPHERSRIYFVADVNTSRPPIRRVACENKTHEVQFPPRLGFIQLFENAVPRFGWSNQPILGRGIPRVPCRVGALQAYGNAIDPRIAAQFIRAYLDCRP